MILATSSWQQGRPSRNTSSASMNETKYNIEMQSHQEMSSCNRNIPAPHRLRFCIFNCCSICRRASSLFSMAYAWIMHHSSLLIFNCIPMPSARSCARRISFFWSSVRPSFFILISRTVFELYGDTNSQKESFHAKILCSTPRTWPDLVSQRKGRIAILVFRTDIGAFLNQMRNPTSVRARDFPMGMARR